MTYSKYPGAIDDDTSLPETVDRVTKVKAEVVNRLRDSVIATESTIGANPAGVHATIKDRLDAMQSNLDSHANTHEDGGIDEITIQNLSSGGAAASKVVVTDGSGGLTLQDYSGGGVFTAGGDLTGDETNQTVSYIKGLETPDPTGIRPGVVSTYTYDQPMRSAAICRDGVGSAGNIYLVEQVDNAKIWKYSVDGGIISFVDKFDIIDVYGYKTGYGLWDITVDSTHIFVPNYSDVGGEGYVNIMDKSTGQTVGHLIVTPGYNYPWSVVVNGDNIYVGTDDHVELFSKSAALAAYPTPITYTTISSAIDQGYQMALDPSLLYLWVTSDAWYKLYKLDATTLATISSLNIGTYAEQVLCAFGSVWVSNQSSATVMRFNPATFPAGGCLLATLTVPASKSVPSGPYGTYGLTSSGLSVYVAHDDKVSIIDPITNTITVTGVMNRGEVLLDIVLSSTSVWAAVWSAEGGNSGYGLRRFSGAYSGAYFGPEISAYKKVRGDLSGDWPDIKITGLVGKTIQNTTLYNGFSLIWNASNYRWEPRAPWSIYRLINGTLGGTYDLDVGDTLVYISKITSGTYTIRLPLGATVGTRILIVDAGYGMGYAGSLSVTIAAQSPHLLDGVTAGTTTIVDGGIKEFILCGGNNWRVR